MREGKRRERGNRREKRERPVTSSRVKRIFTYLPQQEVRGAARFHRALVAQCVHASEHLVPADSSPHSTQDGACRAAARAVIPSRTSIG
eukprot:scaffold142485_cov33-Tisochrysis_lutea.AAC.3